MPRSLYRCLEIKGFSTPYSWHLLCKTDLVPAAVVHLISHHFTLQAPASCYSSRFSSVSQRHQVLFCPLDLAHGVLLSQSTYSSFLSYSTWPLLDCPSDPTLNVTAYTRPSLTTQCNMSPVLWSQNTQSLPPLHNRYHGLRFQIMDTEHFLVCFRKVFLVSLNG